MSAYIESAAIISDDGVYRYSLRRLWDEHRPVLCIVGLNPSTADATEDDPTIRREVGFARAWSFGGIVKLNLFAFRSTDPKVMRRAFDPIGPQNDPTIRAEVSGRFVLCAWGAHGGYMGRDAAVCGILANHARDAICLGITRAGFPRHPLYVPSSAVAQPFTLIGDAS